MTATTSILPEKLHEYPQQDVIDASGAESASILDDCLNQNDGSSATFTSLCGQDILQPG
jgi:hypothetical protein